jgi:ectoine hydroxylase-related dioxygenase (phytanoyl-CoA dioxygenase family)
MNKPLASQVRAFAPESSPFGKLANYGRDGIVFPLPVLTPTEVERFAAGFARLSEAFSFSQKRFDQTHLYFTWAYELACHPVVLDAVEQVLGRDIVIWGSLIISKFAQDPGFVAWHQDGAYADFLAGTPAVSAWIALTDSTVESGCMRVVPGSHLHKHAHTETHAPDNLLNRGQEIALAVDEATAVNVDLRAGEMSLHDISIIHGSSANRASRPRTGFIVRYMTPQVVPERGTLVLARGMGALDHMRYVRATPPGSFRAQLAAYRMR